MKEQEGTHKNAEGLSLHWRAWQPDDTPRGVLLFVHGLAEHSGRYGNVASYFSARGYACWAIDLRGHGQSAGRRVHVRSFEDYAEDVAALRSLADEHHPDLPKVIIGHSMGGLITLLEVLRRPDGLEGAVVSSPLLGPHPQAKPSALLHALSQFVSWIAPGMLFPSDLNVDDLCRDPEIVRAYSADPLVTRKVSARWYTSALEAMDLAFQEAHGLRLPILLMQSGADRLVDPEATHRWAAAASADLVDFVVWDGFYHEMFNEPEHDAVFERMLASLTTWFPG